MNAAINQPRWLSLRPRGPLSSAEAVAKPTRWIYVITARKQPSSQDPEPDPRRVARLSAEPSRVDAC